MGDDSWLNDADSTFGRTCSTATLQATRGLTETGTVRYVW